LAFVRAKGRELGHLAAPPRTPATIAGTRRNVEHARRVIGAAPALENVATLVEPLGSTLDEPSWTSSALAESGAELLLDLHNLLTNARNAGLEPLTLLDALPLERVSSVHIAGGCWITADDGGLRLLDDHLHAVPEEVFELLSELGARAPQPLQVVLERDGHFPDFKQLLAEIERARSALSLGRARRVDWRARTTAVSPALGGLDDGRQLETLMTELYLDNASRARFLEAPEREAGNHGLSAEIFSPRQLDAPGLRLTGSTFRAKLRQHAARAARAR
jgi:hypothetical protein